MIRQHLDLHFSEEARSRWIQLILKAADIEIFPTDPEFRSAMVAYFEWGTPMNQVFLDGTPVPEKSRMPLWGWGERKPYIPAI
jgi:hemoglobin